MLNRLLSALLLLSVACGSEPPACEGASCGGGPRIKLSPQGEFGHIVCQGEAADCILDLGLLQVSQSAESWTTLENVGSDILHLEAFEVSEPDFEVQHPAVELEPGETISFRLRTRIDEAGRQLDGELIIRSDAVNGNLNATGCVNGAGVCGMIRVQLRASTAN
jgi:hypothetical protein